jgi:hypothetical protein
MNMDDNAVALLFVGDVDFMYRLFLDASFLSVPCF